MKEVNVDELMMNYFIFPLCINPEGYASDVVAEDLLSPLDDSLWTFNKMKQINIWPTVKGLYYDIYTIQIIENIALITDNLPIL